MRKFVTLMSLAGLFLVGCEKGPGSSLGMGEGKPQKLVVGSVDTATVLHADPDYMPMSEQYLRERMEIQAEFVKETKGLNRQDQAAVAKIQEKYTDKEKKLAASWKIKTDEFLKSRHSRIEQIAAEICKDKKIDMVIIDSKQYATVEYGAVDITPDILLKTSGGSAPPPASPGEPK